jgi:copper(I)-binding protein
MTEKVAITGMGLAGVIHLLLAPFHYGHAPAHGIFFVIAGIAEIGWALVFWRRPSRRSFLVGLAMAGGLLVLWAITRFALAPFEHETGAVDLGGLACKASELVSILALASMATQGKIIGWTRMPPVRVGAIALALALVSGAALYGVGHAIEPLQPLLGSAQEHDEASGNHQPEGESEETSEHNEMDAAGAGHAEDASDAAVATLGPIRIEDAWAGPAAAGANGAAYLTISNAGNETVRLVAVSSDLATPEFWQSVMEEDVMQMKPLPGGVEVPAGGRLELAPGGIHIMLIDLQRALAVGDVVQIGLQFEGFGDAWVQAEVRRP